MIHGLEYLVHLLSKGVTCAYYWLVSIKSNIFIRSTLCFNFLCSTTLSHRHVASEDSRRQESKPDEEQFQLLFLLLPCAVSVPSAFPVPFQCLFQCLFTVCVRLPVILPCDSLFYSLLLKRDSLSFCFSKTYQKHIFAGRATIKVQKALERDWEQTRHMATVAGTARHHLKTTHACASVGLRSPSTPSTVDGRNIQTLSTTTRTPPTPKLNVRGLARMFRRMDETNQTLETQIQSSYVQH